MTRFQAQTNAVLETQLEELRECFGLRENQKADLLREIAAIASWVVSQAAAGRRVEARGADGVEVLESPVVARLRESRARGLSPTLLLADEEVARLASILDGGFSPTPALRGALARLADPSRALPALRWPASQVPAPRAPAPQAPALRGSDEEAPG